jgi:cytochrome b561
MEDVMIACCRTWIAVASRWRQCTARRDAGQATAEYALVLLGAAAVALLLIGWATTTDQVSRLFDFVVDQVVGRAE